MLRNKLETIAPVFCTPGRILFNVKQSKVRQRQDCRKTNPANEYQWKSLTAKCSTAILKTVMPTGENSGKGAGQVGAIQMYNGFLENPPLG